MSKYLVLALGVTCALSLAPRAEAAFVDGFTGNSEFVMPGTLIPPATVADGIVNFAVY